MQKFKTLFFILALMIFSFLIAPSYTAYADSPAPPSYFYSYVSKADSNVKYTEILVKISKSSKYYTDLNTSNSAPYGFNKSTPIVAYNKDGYVSVSFHYIKVHVDPSILTADSRISEIIEFKNNGEPINTITDSIKIALLDKSGNVLKVSNAVSVKPTANNTFPRSVKYDAGSTTPSIEFEKYYGTNHVTNYGTNHGTSSAASGTYYLTAFMLLACFIRMIISTGIETLIAVPYKIKPLWKIIVVNIITQVLLFSLIAFGGLDYTVAVIAGEILVYISEYVAYIFLFRNISKAKLALYTVTANTASLAVGLILNYFHVLVG